MTRKEKALKKFRNGHSCSQVVFSAFSDISEMDESFAEVIASGFGAGIARTQSVCGAITGGIMALGAINKQLVGDNTELKEQTYSDTQLFIKQFANRNEFTSCADLMEKKPDDDSANVKYFNIIDPCEQYVCDAIDIIEKLIKTKK